MYNLLSSFNAQCDHSPEILIWANTSPTHKSLRKLKSILQSRPDFSAFSASRWSSNLAFPSLKM